MKWRSYEIGVILWFICIPFITGATVKLPAIFSDGMVLQQQSDVAIWGYSDKEAVMITTSWDQRQYMASPSAGATWRARIVTPPAGGPYTIKITGNDNEILIEDVLIGEVWLASGQSNMEMPLKGFPNQPVNNSQKVIAGSQNPEIRFFNIENKSWAKPLNDVNGKWTAASEKTAPDFSATAYFFALELYKRLNVPVAIVEADWGGTVIQAWMSTGSLSAFPEVDVKPLADAVYSNKNEPAGLYNAMIHPLIGYGIKGVIWYQGEQNRHEPELYEKLFPEMVKQWRKEWGIGEYPFYYVQIAPYIHPDPDNMPESAKKLGPFVPYLREAQLKTASIIPNSGMAVLMDVGAPTTIHPPYKDSVGKRLSYLALNKTYGFRNVSYSGPVFRRKKIKGDHVILYFDHAEGLYLKNGVSNNFEIAGSDKVFHPASAKIEDNIITVYSAKVPHPVAVRYAFKAWAAGDLFNSNNLPASSFRTDNWPVKR